VAQYWFFYYFNQFNDLHESDWEGMQIVFDAGSAEEALASGPAQIVLFQHSGGEKADWDANKVEKEGTHPVVYPAAGSHATFYESAIFVENGQGGSGLGCDNTSRPVRRVAVQPRLVPTAPRRGSADQWLTYDGRWGQKEKGYNNGPTGPNTKTQWREPFDWMEDVRSTSPTLPGGSVLGPASYSGISGLRPTYGLVPRTGVMALSWTMDKVGILARSARDIAVVLGAIAGPDGRDESAIGRFVPLDARRARAAVKRVRIGFAGVDVEQCDPVMHRRLAAGIAELQRVVPRFTRAEIRSDLPYTTILELVLLAEAATIFAEHLEAPHFDLVDERQRAELRSGLEIRARDYLQAMRTRRVIADDFRRVFQGVDVIVSAGRSETAPWLDRIAKHRSSATVPDRLRSAANLAGVPGVFFPIGLADDGMPVGLQLVGPPRSEPLLLAIAAAFQRETGHHLVRPPLA